MSEPARAPQPAPTIRHRLEYAALRAVVAALSPLPWQWASSIGGWIGTLGYWPLGIRRRLTQQQVDAAFPDLDAAARRRIVRGAYENLGRVAIESAKVSRLSRGAVLDLFHPPEGWEHIAEPLARGQGVIAVSAHFGNWELAAAYLAARDLKTDVVVRRLTNPLVDGYVLRSRRRLGWTAVADRDAVRHVPRAIAAGHIVPMLADQGVKGLASTYVPFFGRLARTPKGPAVLARRLGAPCVMAAIVRQPDKRYRISFQPVPVTDTGDRDSDIDSVVAAYTSLIEQWIRRYPEQYLWQHRRWRRRPDGTFED